MSGGGRPDGEARNHLSPNKQPSSLVTPEQLDSELWDPERPDFFVFCISRFFRCRLISCTDEEALLFVCFFPNNVDDRWWKLSKEVDEHLRFLGN